MVNVLAVILYTNDRMRSWLSDSWSDFHIYCVVGWEWDVTLPELKFIFKDENKNLRPFVWTLEKKVKFTLNIVTHFYQIIKLGNWVKGICDIDLGAGKICSAIKYGTRWQTLFGSGEKLVKKLDRNIDVPAKWVCLLFSSCLPCLFVTEQQLNWWVICLSETGLMQPLLMRL